MTVKKKTEKERTFTRNKKPMLTAEQTYAMAKKYAAGSTMQDLLEEYKLGRSSFYRHIKAAEIMANKPSGTDYKKLYEQAQSALAELYLENKRLKAI